ncbi:DUF4232 domain-containing protein [Streptacidiphilus griseoplanus]|uniref:DUF4232 domain-containing protein n=1 Tax=Peterkaempfera griseoplana TaxID=66896 RepID=UPI001FDF8CF4|nr:DUF4232 domain-containing protein [Peterkaempfera griseoplana]
MAIHQSIPNGRHHREVPEGASPRAGRVRYPLLAATAVLIAVLSGCGTGGGTGGGGGASPAHPQPATTDGSSPSGPASSGPSTPEAAPTTDSSTTAAAPSPTTADSSPSVATAAGSSRCHTADLRASIGRNDPGAGQENFPIVLTNRSNRTCTVYGFPGVAFVNSAGEQVTVDPERATGQQKQLVRLTPGQSAWSPMSFSNPAISGVTTVTPVAVLITPPDETSSLRVPWAGGEVSNTGKASVPQVGPFRPGSGV